MDSWLEAIGHRLSCTWGDLTDALALSTAGASAPWLIRLTPAEADNLSHATAQPTARLHAMTLAGYDGKGLRISPERRTLDRTFPWTRTRFSRYCPHCLRTSGGRWQLSWRSGWAFACLRHQCLLVDECPQCGRPQRERSHPTEQTPKPGYCAQPALAAVGRARECCGADLAAAATIDLASGHPALVAQRAISAVIVSGTVEFGIYHEDPQPSAGLLADIGAVAGRILGYATADDWTRILPPDLDRAYKELRTHAGGGTLPFPASKRGPRAPSHAVIAAAGITAAMEILTARDCGDAGHRLRWLVDSGRANGLAVTASNIGWGRRTTPVLTAAQLNALAPRLKPSEQLRYRIGAVRPNRPAGTAASIADLAAKLPAALWPSWALRLTLPGQDFTHLSTALPCAVMLVNSRLSCEASTKAMDRQDADRHSLSHTLQQLHGDRHWPHIRDALVRLSDYLQSQDTPIDYRRRRSLDFDPLLESAVWRDICVKLDVRSGGEKRHRMARCFLYSMITASPGRYAPWFRDENEFSAPLANFPTLLTPELLSALQQEAQRFLHINDIKEPLVWSPPQQLLADLSLPGCDPTGINLVELHRLVRNGLALSDIADQLGASLAAVRHVLALHPAPELQRSHAFRPAPALSSLAAMLTADELMGLYVGQQLPLRVIAARYGVGRKVVAQLARHYGIEVRPPNAPRRYAAIDRDWLYAEYVINQRTLPELAAEKGMSTMNMSRWAKCYGIPLRGRGGPSHAAAIAAVKTADNAPPLLKTALRVNGGEKRLARFAAASRYPSVTAAAAELGLSQSVLHTQINRLEADLGGLLLTRAERNHPMVLTALGTRVLRSWNAWASDVGHSWAAKKQ
ncbi:MAG: TniQ family protein [Actinomycetia bacterium]|nr:TniQ family protein [Actinomycetes bacterium]